MSRALIWAIQLYQHTVGLVLPRVCRFEPTCSSYAVQALREHGWWRGTALTVRRILRCNPFSTGGWDPVPRRTVEHE